MRGIDFLCSSDKAAVPGLNRNHLPEAQVWFPGDIKEQRAITHTLGRLDDKIELNRRINETLEAVAWGLFTAWFVDFEPGHAKATLKQHAATHSPLLPALLDTVLPYAHFVVACITGAIKRKQDE